jgi:short-subunit dehydrogenase
MKVFITGGTGGIGKGFALHYLSQGFEVGICGGTQKDFIAAFPDRHSALSFYEVDVTNRPEINQCIKDFSKGNLSLLIACAGINNGEPHNDRPLNFDREIKIIDVNLLGTIHAFEAAISIMQPLNQGQLVAVSSAAGLAGMPEAPAYSASKGALITYCEALSIRLKKNNIKVTVLAPGYIDTPLARSTVKHFETKSNTMTVEQAVPLMVSAIERKDILYIFPTNLKIISVILRFLPRKFYHRIAFFFFQKNVERGMS